MELIIDIDTKMIRFLFVNKEIIEYIKIPKVKSSISELKS